MDSSKVNPEKWQYDPAYPIKILYDDGEYSVIWGKYEGVPSLGARWNGDISDRGHPGQGGYPTWFVEPDFLAKAILKEILYNSIRSGNQSKVADIRFAIQELERKVVVQDSLSSIL